MHERKSVENLIKDLSNCGLGEMRFPLLDHLIQVLLHVLEHEVESVILANHLFQFHYVGVR